MSGMNPWLASIYGTDGADDLEKTAQTHLLQKLAEEQQIDLSQFSPEELQQLLQEVMGEQVMAQGQQAQPGLPQQGAPQQQPPQGQHPAMAQAFAPAAQPQVPQGMAPGAMQPQGGGADMASMQKEAQAKFEEADLLGRVMAHAYTQELEKIAASKEAGLKDKAKSIAGKAMHAGGVAKAHLAPGSSSKAGKAAKYVGAGAAGFAAGRASKTKEASAFEKLAEMHAADILGAAGVDPATGQDQWASQQAPEQTQQVQQDVQGQQGQQGQVEQPQGNEEQFAQALDSRALEMLAEAGYDTDQLVARIQYAQQQAAQGNQGQS